MNIWSIFILLFIKSIIIVKSTDLKFKWADFNNYHTKIEFKYKDNSIFLEDYSYNSINKLIVKSNELNYDFQLIYNSNLDHLYKIKGDSLQCDYFNIFSSDYYLENLGPFGFIYFNKTEINNYSKIGPSAFLNLILNDELEFIKEENKQIRGLNAIVYKNKNKFNKFNLENIDLSLIFKSIDNKPIQIRTSFIYKEEKFDLLFDYFNFKRFDELERNGQSIAFPIACNGIKNIHKRPDFKLENMVKIDFNDVSSHNQVIKTKFFIDKQAKIIRLERDEENIQILDMKNRVKYTENLNNDCDLEFYSSNQKFSEERTIFYKNVHLILNIGNITNYTFVGNDFENNYLREKFQIITPIRNGLLAKKTLYFNGNNLDMLLYEEFDKNTNKIKRNITLEINEIKSLDYNENYRDLFTMPNCELNEHLYVHLYSLPYENDLHLKEKLEFLKNREDFVLSKLLKSLKYDIKLDLNAFSTSNLEQQSRQFVVNSKIINVENYLDSFQEIENVKKVSSSYFKIDIRKCAKMVLDNKKYSGFKQCKNKCYLITDNLDNKNDQNNQDCKTFRRKRNKKIDYNFHKLSSNLNRLINRKNRYSIQIEHNVKFVFTKIRFSNGLNLIDNRNNFFLQFKDKTRIKNPIDEFDNYNSTRLISPLDCYTKCIKNNKCNSFSFCKMHNTDGKVDISCQLSDHIFLDENQNSIINHNNLHNKLDDRLIDNNFCQTFNINYLNHFHSKGKSMIGTSKSLKSQLVNSQEECARECFSFNQDKKMKCGKLEICSKKSKFQCNLKPFNDDEEIELKNKSCEYFKIDYLVDYHQIELNENDNLKLISLDEKIDDCAKGCSSIESCNEFNFCWSNNLSNNDLKNQIGYCIRHEKSNSNFNPEKKVLNCITLMKNDKVYFNESNNKPKIEIEHNPNELSQRVFALFLIVSMSLGLILGFISFEYYNRKIAPAYKASPGTYYPTRLFVNKKTDDQNDIDNKKEIEIKIENQLENDVNYLKDINNLNENRKKSTNLNENEFTDINL